MGECDGEVIESLWLLCVSGGVFIGVVGCGCEYCVVSVFVFYFVRCFVCGYEIEFCWFDGGGVVLVLLCVVCGESYGEVCE